MSKKIDPLDPEYSPNILQQSGVRRVNNMPLYIVMAAVVIFVLLIAMVMVKRSNPIERVEKKLAQKNPTDSSLLAENILSASPEKIRPTNINNMDQMIAVPIAKTTSNEPPRPPRLRSKTLSKGNDLSPEYEKLLQMKVQEFKNSLEGTMIKGPGKKSLKSNTDSINSSFKAELAAVRQRSALKKMSNEEFIHSNDVQNEWQLNSKIEAPQSPYEIRTGFIIPCVLDIGIKSTLPGTIEAHVSQNVYDTATGKFLLIPQGTKVFGKYSTNIGFGQDTLLSIWQRLIFPDAKVLDLGAMSGADSAGNSGFRDEVNHHYARIYSSAFLMSGIIAGITYSQSRNQGYFEAQPTAGSVLSASLGQQLGQTTAELLAKNINIAPTIKIRPGYEFNIVVTKDLIFDKPYQAFDYQFTE